MNQNSKIEYVDVAVTHAMSRFWRDKRFKIAYSGRNAGKSWGFAQELTAKGHEQPLNIFCAREIQKSIKSSVLKLLSNTIKRNQLNHIYDVQRAAIHHPNGTEFSFIGLSHNIDNVRGIEDADIVYISEAQNASQESLDTLIPTIRKPGSQIWMDLNPKFKTDPVYARFIAPYLDELNTNGFYEDDRHIIVKTGYWDNPWVSKESREEMEWCKQHDYDKYRHIWLGECIEHNDSRVFNNWREDELDIPKDAVWYYGADWGFSQDPTVLIRCYCDHDERILYIDHEAYGSGVEIDNTPALFDKMPEARKWHIKADSARPETISYMRRYGFKISGARKGPGSVEEGVKFLQSYDIVVHPRCKNLLYELQHYSYKVDKHTDEVTPVLLKKNDHCIDALRYALEKLAFNKSRFHI